MNNQLTADLLPLLSEDWAGADRLRLKDEATAGRPLYYTHKGRITNASKRLRISMPYDRTRIEQDETIFTASGLKFPYPGGFDLPETYAKHEASLLSAEFLGEEDGAAATWMARTAMQTDEVKRRKDAGTLFAFQLKGLTELLSLSPDTLLALAKVLESVRRHGEDDTLRLYTQPHRNHTLVTLAVAGITLQFIPLPVPASVLKGREVWRIDNPQLSIA